MYRQGRAVRFGGSGKAERCGSVLKEDGGFFAGPVFGVERARKGAPLLSVTFTANEKRASSFGFVRGGIAIDLLGDGQGAVFVLHVEEARRSDRIGLHGPLHRIRTLDEAPVEARGYGIAVVLKIAGIGLGDGELRGRGKVRNEDTLAPFHSADGGDADARVAVVSLKFDGNVFADSFGIVLPRR